MKVTPEQLGARYLAADPAARPTLCVVVDTEEEFDWDTPFSRQNTSVRAIEHLPAAQSVFRRYGAVPTYVVDFPVAADADATGMLRSLLASGECAIGAHLHPWVTPPFLERLSAANSFSCNLGVLQEAKLQRLKERITESFGRAPRVYKAGRYGFDRTTVRVLQKLQFGIDVSVCPHMTFEASGGPSFTAFDARPFAFGRDAALLELPCTAGFTGIAGSARRALRALAEHPRAARLHLAGALSRARITDRVMLSPEGHSLAEMCRLTRTLLAEGLRTFTLSFHSPSLEPGHTPYVRDRAGLQRFIATLDRYLEFFLTAADGVTCTLEEFRDRTFSHPPRRIAAGLVH